MIDFSYLLLVIQAVCGWVCGCVRRGVRRGWVEEEEEEGERVVLWAWVFLLLFVAWWEVIDFSSLCFSNRKEGGVKTFKHTLCSMVAAAMIIMLTPLSFYPKGTFLSISPMPSTHTHIHTAPLPSQAP
jgi:hypothetical protein